MDNSWLTIEENDNGKVLGKCSSEASGEIVIPDGVTMIGNCAFGGCKGLSSVVIPDSVQDIGTAAFMACTGLTSVTMGKSVKSIKCYAFSLCTGLKSLVVPESVAEIQNAAFDECYNLSLQLPKSLKGIVKDAFKGCKKVSYYG